MSTLNRPEYLILTHTVNACIHFGKAYIIQSRATQQANILKAFGEWIPMPTFDKAIARLKKRWNLWKQHRTKTVRGIGKVWTSSITHVSWALVIKMRRMGLLTAGQMIQLRRIFDGMQKRGPAKLRATPATQDGKTGKASHHAFLFPT